MKTTLNITRYSYLGFLPLAMLGGEADAAGVYVEFSSVDPMGVPFSPWALGLTGLLLALFAYRGLKGRGVGNGWPLAVFMVTGVLALVPAKSWLSDAMAAIEVTTFDLAFPSPATSPPVPYGQDISLVNTTGQTIKIDTILAYFTGWEFATAPPVWELTCSPTLQPECQQGTVLAPASVCYVRMCPGPYGQ